MQLVFGTLGHPAADLALLAVPYQGAANVFAMRDPIIRARLPLQRITGEPVKPRPRPRRLAQPLQLEEVAINQRSDCGHRIQCLGHAARRSWPSFTCRDCKSYAPLSSDALREELASLTALGRALSRVAR